MKNKPENFYYHQMKLLVSHHFANVWRSIILKASIHLYFCKQVAATMNIMVNQYNRDLADSYSCVSKQLLANQPLLYSHGNPFDEEKLTLYTTFHYAKDQFFVLFS